MNAANTFHGRTPIHSPLFAALFADLILALDIARGPTRYQYDLRGRNGLLVGHGKTAFR